MTVFENVDFHRLVTTLQALELACDDIDQDAPDATKLSAIVERGYLRPLENESIGFWFARYLSIREALRDLVDVVLEQGDKPVNRVGSDDDWRLFLVGYAVACLLIRIDRMLLFRVATHSTIQRKLNEAWDEYRIPRKEYTRIYAAYVDQRDARMMLDAVTLVRRGRKRLARMATDPLVGFIAGDIHRFQVYIDPSRRSYARSLIRYISHISRRRGVVFISQALALTMEQAGRTVSEVGGRDVKQVGASVVAQLADLLHPGDILVTRHDHVLTNLFLPGYWPHTALYIGTPEQRKVLSIHVTDEQAARWQGNRCVLEALKDGVRFRPLAETLKVDKVAVLRPRITSRAIAKGIARAVQHEGKLYNFDFDFFNTDRLVCSEVIYRAFDGLEGIVFPLAERAGRPTLSAEDIIEYALDSGMFVPIALYGVCGCEHNLTTDDSVSELLRKSYQREN